MVLKRSLENSGSENTKKQKLDSKELLEVNNENKPELVIDLTEEEEYVEPENRLDVMVHACRNGQIETVEQLLKLDFDVNSRDSSNNTALHHASANGHDKIVEKLLENGADPNLTNESQFTPLHLASLNGHTKVIKELLKQKVDVSVQTKHGENALEFASRNGHLSAVKEILNLGVKAARYILDRDIFPVLHNLKNKLSHWRLRQKY